MARITCPICESWFKKTDEEMAIAEAKRLTDAYFRMAAAKAKSTPPTNASAYLKAVGRG